MRRALAIACAVLPLGCRQLLSSDSYHFESTSPEPSADASDERASGTDASDATTCKLAVPPEKTLMTETGGAVDLVFVMRKIDLGDVRGTDGVPGYVKLGYDLDGRCTSGGDPATCVNPLPPGPDQDGHEGVDDALGHMISDIKPRFGQEIITSALVNDEVARDALAPTSILHIKGYTGLQDDNHVDVDWLFPVLPNASDGGDAATDAAPSPPAWDGKDVWPVQPPTFVEPPSPDGTSPGGAVIARASTDGYVSHYRLVARFPDGITYRFWHFNVSFYGAVITADIVPNAATNQFELRNGIVAGRAPIRDVTALIPLMTSRLPAGTPLCTDSPLYGAIHDWMCGFPDMTATPGSEPRPRCNMLSVAMGFESVPAKIGATIDEPPPPKLCPKETDPSIQGCDPPADAGMP
jgi:hypothetical protein